MKKMIFALLAMTSALPVFSQAIESNESHDGRINHIVPIEMTRKENGFYTVGDDGFVIKWSDDGFGDHYQMSNIPIKLIARNPVSQTIAIYETDGIAEHRIDVVKTGSGTFEKVFSKKLKNPVTSLAFSEKGTVLIVGTAAVGGTIIFDAADGKPKKKIDDFSGIISMARTSPSEKTAVMYSKSGTLVYYDMVQEKVKMKISTQSNLEQTVLFGTGKYANRFFAGTKDNVIYIIDATSGKTVTTQNATAPLLLSSKQESETSGLYYITPSGRNQSLFMIEYSSLENKLTNPSSAPAAPLLIKNFTGLKNKETITSCAKNSGKIILGTSRGDIYTFSDAPESELYSLLAMTEKMHENILDIGSMKDECYLLTQNTLYKTSYKTREQTVISSNQGNTDISIAEDKIIMWKRNSRKAVQVVDSSSPDSQPKTLFTPKGEIRNMNVADGKLVYILGTSTVGIYDMTAGTNKEVYTGTSIQDAILMGNNLYVAKTSTGLNDAPIINVNISTQETVPLKATGNVAFSLCRGGKNDSSTFYGINIKDHNTELFSYNIQSSMYRTLMNFQNEDTGAFTAIKYPNIYSNIGRNEIIRFNMNEKKKTNLKRSASIPKKIVFAEQDIAVLNYDGTIAWYKGMNTNNDSVWYLSTEGDWFER